MSASNAEVGSSTGLTLPPYLADPPELRLNPRALPPYITFTKQIVPLSELPPEYPFYQIRTRLGKFVLGWYEFSSAVELTGIPDSELARAGDVYIDRYGCRVWVCYAAAGREWQLWEGNAAVKAGSSRRHPLFPSRERRSGRWSYLMWFTGKSFRWTQHISVILLASHWTASSVGGAWICERYSLERREGTVSFGTLRDVIEMWEDANQFPRVERSQFAGEMKDATVTERTSTKSDLKAQDRARRSVFGTAESPTRRAPCEILASVINSVHDRNQRETRVSDKNKQRFPSISKAIKRAARFPLGSPVSPGSPFNRSSAPSPSHCRSSSPFSENPVASTSLRDKSTLSPIPLNRRHILPQPRVSTSISSERSLHRSREPSKFRRLPSSSTQLRRILSEIRSPPASPPPDFPPSTSSTSLYGPSPLPSPTQCMRLSPQPGLSSSALAIRELPQPPADTLAWKHEPSLTPTMELQSIVFTPQIETSPYHMPSLSTNLDTKPATPRLMSDRRVPSPDFMGLSPSHNIVPAQPSPASPSLELSIPPTAAQRMSASPTIPLPTQETSASPNSLREPPMHDFSPEEPPSSSHVILSTTDQDRVRIGDDTVQSDPAHAENKENEAPMTLICTRCIEDGVAETCNIEGSGQRCHRCKEKHYKCSNTSELGKRKREPDVDPQPQVTSGRTQQEKRRRLDPVVREMVKLGRRVGSIGARGLGERVLRSKMSTGHPATRVRVKIPERVAHQLMNRRSTLARVSPGVRRSIRLASSSKQHVTPRWKPTRKLEVIAPSHRSVAPRLRTIEQIDECRKPLAGAQGQVAFLEELGDDDEVVEDILMEGGGIQGNIHDSDEESSVADVAGQRAESSGGKGVHPTSEAEPPSTPNVVPHNKPVGWAAMKDRMIYIERAMEDLVGAVRDLRREMELYK
ncbi:hypothetical protein EVG20_g10538 [Dentipellis fragilis]|uniref:Uncharacterized protein n=1 Tax=Dentipellis fragilis TaxID=205917 RepID=A0A4Y9XST9_9AGAM|nr:hypothetical protein EVG20_g10538 [Dentipellis fragilis]